MTASMRPTRPDRPILFFKSRTFKEHPGYRLERHRWHRAADAKSVFAPARQKGESRGTTMAAVLLTPSHIEPLSRAMADLLVQVPPVNLPERRGPNLRTDAMRAARKTADYMRRNDLAIVNHGSGALIQLSTKGLRHAKSMSGDERAALLMYKLPSALSRAVYFKTEQPDARKKDKKHIVAYHKFAVPVSIPSSGLALAILHVEEDDHGHFYYDGSVSPEIKKPGDCTSGVTGRLESGQEPCPRQAYIDLIWAALEVKPGLGEIHTFFRKAWVPALAGTGSRPMSYLIDLSAVPDHCCNHGLEALHKAIAEEPSESLIWTPHDNPWLAALCEDFTRNGEARLLAALEALLAALGIVSSHEPLLRKADPWPPEKLAAVKARLQKPLADYAPANWLALIDLIIQTKLAPVDLDAQAAWLAYRAQLAARLDAPGAPAARPGAHGGPVGAGDHHVAPPLTATMKSAWEWAKARIGNHLTLLTDSLRARVSGIVIAHIQEHGLAALGRFLAVGMCARLHQMDGELTNGF